MVINAEQDRRAYIRAKRVLSIEYRLHQKTTRTAEKKWHLSTTYDMSVNGLSFFSEVEYRIDDILDINVSMSGLLEIYCGLGQVCRIQNKKGGAHFFVALELIEKSSPNTKRKNSTKTKTSKKRVI